MGGEDARAAATHCIRTSLAWFAQCDQPGSMLAKTGGISEPKHCSVLSASPGTNRQRGRTLWKVQSAKRGDPSLMEEVKDRVMNQSELAPGEWKKAPVGVKICGPASPHSCGLRGQKPKKQNTHTVCTYFSQTDTLCL